MNSEKMKYEKYLQFAWQCSLDGEHLKAARLYRKAVAFYPKSLRKHDPQNANDFCRLALDRSEQEYAKFKAQRGFVVNR